MDLPVASYGIAVAGGALIGLLLAVFGGGGSVLATPLLVYLVGVRDPHVAIGTAAAAVAVNALFGLATQARAGTVKWPCATVFGGAGLAGSIVGAQLAKQMDGQALLTWFGVAMAAVGISMLVPQKGLGDPGVRLTGALTLKLAPVGLVVGLAAGFFGIGGGFLIVPGLMAATGMTLTHAAASSLVSVVLFGSATSASYAASGMVDWPVFAALVAGGAAGVLASKPVVRLLAQRAVLGRRLFATLVLATAAYVIWRSLS
ncbi:sulfite exporter TauE/SafE family protein [uncultured Phenylobacterium sp.]|uniref:sulfite exporter TauE/SafE family protein n=1 Tax=uncultured Phenylobacterium sp. TaxID=349273 RepID=UPI0025F55019|nr:sulfite exporter TauE/SafE family protein [uncultured Phenylobacterium sp.]